MLTTVHVRTDLRCDGSPLQETEPSPSLATSVRPLAVCTSLRGALVGLEVSSCVHECHADPAWFMHAHILKAQCNDPSRETVDKSNDFKLNRTPFNLAQYASHI